MAKPTRFLTKSGRFFDNTTIYNVNKLRKSRKNRFTFSLLLCKIETDVGENGRVFAYAPYRVGGIFMKSKILYQLNIENFLCENKVSDTNETNKTNKEMNVIELIECI